MLILVGVTINFVQNGGILTKAKQASRQYQIEADRETLLSCVVASIGLDGKVNIQDLNTEATKAGFTVDSNGYTSSSGNTYAVDEYGNIEFTGGGNGGTVVQDTDLTYLRSLIGQNLYDLLEEPSGLIFIDKNMEVNETELRNMTEDDFTDNGDGSYTERIPIYYKNKPYTMVITYREGEGVVPITDITTRTVTPSGSSSSSSSSSGSYSGEDSSSSGSYYSSDDNNYAVRIYYGTGIEFNSAYNDYIAEGETFEIVFNTASDYYELPKEITVQMGETTLNSSEYTWDSSTGELSIPNVTGNLVITIAGDYTGHSVSFHLTNVTFNGVNAAVDGGTYEATIAENEHYNLPETITVTMGGTTLDVSNNEYTWNSTTGEITVPNVTGDLSITVTGEQIVRNVTINATNVTSNGALTINDGEGYICEFTADSNYSLPSTITVEMDGTTLDSGKDTYKWDSVSGSLSVLAVTGDLTITVTGEYITDISEIAYNNLETTLNSNNSTLGTDLKNAIDDGKVSKVLMETVDGVPTIAVIPTGFTVSATPGENTISQGLVVRDGSNNEFVWIPVPTLSDIAVPQSQGSSDYRGVLYDWQTDSTGATAYTWNSNSYFTGPREPANLKGTIKVNSQTLDVDGQEAFTYYGGGTYTSTMYQEEFNEMAGSVETYKGFYVGRYETGGFNGNAVVVKAGETGTEDENSANNSINNVNWYKAYRMQKDFASNNTNVGSSMIWGCQWDQVMKFVNNKLDGAGNLYYVKGTRTTRHTNKLEPTGSNINDKVQNIYDLEGNVMENTLEAENTKYRRLRGGVADKSASYNYAAFRNNSISPTSMTGRKPYDIIYKRTSSNT